jgi:hypothetical protein
MLETDGDAGGGQLLRSSLGWEKVVVRPALAGGQVRIPAMTAHVEASLELLEAIGFEPAVDTSGESPVISMNRSAV